MVPKFGAPSKVIPEDLKAVQAVTRTRAAAGNAVFQSDLGDLIEEQRQTRLKNKHQEIPAISRSTLASARSKLDLAEITADRQTLARTAAKADLRNGITLCAASAACLEDVLPQLTFCFDEVSFFLEDRKKPLVVAPRDLVAELRASHQSVKVSTPQSQRRTISMLNFVARDGVRLHTALRLMDKHIQSLSEHLISPTLSIWLYPPQTNETVFVDKFFKERIIPLMCQKRCSIAVGLLAGPSVFLSDEVSHFAAQHEDALDEKCFSLRTVMCMDGDGPQTQAFMDLKLGTYCSEYNIEYLKLAAACSGHESPLDLAKSHQLMRAAIHNPRYNYKMDPIPSFAMTVFIDDVLSKSGIAAASLRTFRKFFLHMESIMDKTFNEVDLQHGWQLAGLCPLSCSTILSHCPLWNSLSNSNAELVLDAIPPLAETVRLKGELTDSEIQAAVGDAVDLGPDKVNPVGPVNHRRCVWGNNAGFVANYAKKKAAEAQAKRLAQEKRDLRADAKKRKAEKAADKENKPSLKKRSKLTTAASTVCGNPMCLTPWNKCASSSARWLGCDFCDLWFCPKPACQAMLSKHEPVCQFLKQ